MKLATGSNHEIEIDAAFRQNLARRISSARNDAIIGGGDVATSSALAAETPRLKTPQDKPSIDPCDIFCAIARQAIRGRRRS